MFDPSNKELENAQTLCTGLIMKIGIPIETMSLHCLWFRRTITI